MCCLFVVCLCQNQIKVHLNMANVLNTNGDEAPGFEGEGVGGKDEPVAGGDAKVSQTSSGVHKDKRFLKDGLLVPNMIPIDVQWKFTFDLADKRCTLANKR